MNTNKLGNLALGKVINDLTSKGCEVYTPISEHGVVDLIALAESNAIRLQVKYSCNGIVRNTSLWVRSDGSKVHTKYSLDSFDFYAVYLPGADTVIYVPCELGGSTIRYDLPDNEKHFYWYKDFINFSVLHRKRKTSEFR